MIAKFQFKVTVHYSLWAKCTQLWPLKGIFSDSNNIFLLYESEDINKKSLFPKFQLIPILRFQVMHDYVYSIAPIHCCVEKSLVSETFLWKLLSFHAEMISAQLLWGSVLLGGVHQKYAKKSHFKNFESALYLTSVSMPLKSRYPNQPTLLWYHRN